MPKSKLPNQVIGNIGLYYICYELSKRGWNVLPTSRNTRGVDLVIYNQNANIMHTAQIKTLSKKTPIPLGKNLDNLIAEFIMVCVLEAEKPQVFVFTTEEMKQREDIQGKIDKGKGKGFWAVNNNRAWDELLQSKLNNWELIGDGC